MIKIILAVVILAGLGVIFGCLLGFASKKFEVEQDPKVPLLRDSLPGANCGGCGFPGCDAYAKAVAEGTAKVGLCSVGGAPVAAKMAEVMGVEAEASEPKVAFVRCSGTSDKAEKRYKYDGIKSCLEATVLPGGGPKSCRYGCLGYGSCVDACQFDAIHIQNGVAVVNPDKCVACGACVKACPKGLIELISKDAKVMPVCLNCDRGKPVTEVCKTGCIGCTMCARNCPEKAITMVKNHPVIDHSLCSGCLTCVQKCPVHVIHPLTITENQTVKTVAEVE